MPGASGGKENAVAVNFTGYPVTIYIVLCCPRSCTFGPGFPVECGVGEGAGEKWIPSGVYYTFSAFRDGWECDVPDRVPKTAKIKQNDKRRVFSRNQLNQNINH